MVFMKITVLYENVKNLILAQKCGNVEKMIQQPAMH
jgi:hypothetical protein